MECELPLETELLLAPVLPLDSDPAPLLTAPVLAADAPVLTHPKKAGPARAANRAALVQHASETIVRLRMACRR